MGVRIVGRNDADDATLTASPAMETTLPVTNLQVNSRARVARSTSAADQAILGDFPGSRALSCLVLSRHNLTAAGTVRLRLYDSTGQGGTELYDSGAVAAQKAVGWGEFEWGVDPWGQSATTEEDPAIFVLYHDVHIARSFRIDISESANADGYLQFTQLLMGRYLEPDIGAQYGARLSWQERSVQTRSDGGTLRTDPRAPYRRMQIDVGFLVEAERRRLALDVQLSGMRRVIFVALYSDGDAIRELQHAMMCKLTRMPDFVRSHPDYHGIQLLLEEA